MLKMSLQVNLYMTQKGHVFVADAMVINPTWKTVTSNVISRPANAAMKFNVTVKIHKYRGLHEGHHFIMMSMEMHGTLKHYMDCFIKECACLFHDRWSKGHLSLSFCIHFFKQYINIVI
jgi:hypothetical protein